MRGSRSIAMSAFFIFGFVAVPAFAENDGDAVAIENCLKHWKKHPFNADSPKFRTIGAKVRVMGIGGELVDSVETKKPELVLVKPSVSVLSKTELKLMNPNGWYCLKASVAVLGKSIFKLNCNANLASSKDGATVIGGSDLDGGVTVLGSSRIQRVGCEAKNESHESKTDDEPSAKSESETN